MVKSVTTANADHLDLPTTSMASCVRILREDGVLLAFWDHDQSKTFDPGGLGSIVHTAGYTRSAISSKEGTGVDNFDLDGIVDSVLITEADIRDGKYNHAEIWTYLQNWADLTQDIIKLKKGRLGDLTLQDGTFEGQFRSLTERLNQNVIELITPDCRYKRLGEVRCGIELVGTPWTSEMSAVVRAPQDELVGTIVKPTTFNDRFFMATTLSVGSPSPISGTVEPTWNTTLGGTTIDGGITWTTIQARTIEATVSLITEDRRVFEVTGSPLTDAPVGFFFEGKINFVDTGSPTPQNFGCKPGIIKDFVVGSPATEATVTLFLPMQRDVEIGDTVELVVGCDRLLDTCIDKFDNVFNFGGFPHLPGNDELFKTPNSTA